MAKLMMPLWIILINGNFSLSRWNVHLRDGRCTNNNLKGGTAGDYTLIEYLSAISRWFGFQLNLFFFFIYFRHLILVI